MGELKQNDKEWRFTFSCAELSDHVMKWNPFEWEDTEYGLKREDGGIFFTFSGEYTYLKSTYDWLISGLDTYGVLWNVTLKIEKLGNHSAIYETYIENKKLDFTSQLESPEHGNSIKIPIINTGFHEKLKSREDEEVRYSSLEDFDGGTITPFANEYEDVLVYGVETFSTGNGTGSGDPVGLFSLDMVPPIIFESDNAGVSSVSLRSLVTTYEQSDMFISCLDIGKIIDLDIVFDFNILRFGSSTTFYLAKTIYDPNTGATSLSSNIYTETGFSNGNNSVTYNTSLTLLLNEGLGIYFTGTTDVLINGFTTLDTTDITISIVEKLPATTLQHVSAFQAHERVIQAITGQADSFVSTVFDTGGKWEHLYLSNGYLYRQYTEAESQLAFKWKELRSEFSILPNLRYGIINDGGVYKVLCEDVTNFYNNTLVHEFTQIKRESFTRELSSKHMYSGVKVGTKKKEHEQPSGLSSYITLCNYSTVLGQVYDNILDLETKYQIDPNWMEFSRRLVKDATETTDSKYDNDICILETIEDSGLKQRTTEDFDTISGIDGITTPINLNLTPARTLRRWSNILSTGLQKDLTSDIKFNKSEILTELSTVRSDESFTAEENESIGVNELDAPLFTGYVGKANIDLSIEDIWNLENNPYYKVQIPNEITDSNFQGWAEMASNKPIGDSLTNIELTESSLITEKDNSIIWPDGEAIDWPSGDSIDWPNI